MKESILNELEDGIGKPLFHYTNLEGLYGILENGNIRCTHISYLNDSEELYHGIELFDKVLEQYNNGEEGIKEFKQKLFNKEKYKDIESFKYRY